MIKLLTSTYLISEQLWFRYPRFTFWRNFAWLNCEFIKNVSTCLLEFFVSYCNIWALPVCWLKAHHLQLFSKNAQTSKIFFNFRELFHSSDWDGCLRLRWSTLERSYSSPGSHRDSIRIKEAWTKDAFNRLTHKKTQFSPKSLKNAWIFERKKEFYFLQIMRSKVELNIQPNWKFLDSGTGNHYCSFNFF